MLKKGQIKFTKKASEKAKTMFETKKANEFLFVVRQSEKKPSGSKDICKILMNVNQNPGFKNKIYTNNIQKTNRLFNEYLLNQCKLNLIISPKSSCALYITREESLKQKYCNLKTKEHVWPAVYLDEKNNTAITTFETIIKTKSIDLADIILSV